MMTLAAVALCGSGAGLLMLAGYFLGWQHGFKAGERVWGRGAG